MPFGSLRSLAAAILLVSTAAIGLPASAGEVQRFEGDVACPDGYSRGIEVDIAQNKTYTTCTKITQADRDAQAQDADFRARQDAAIEAATAESQAWNAANPGRQKCVQWGPIVHANGVTTASGGVCANPVEPGAGTTVPTQDAPPVRAPETSTPSSTPRTETGATGAVNGGTSTTEAGTEPTTSSVTSPTLTYAQWGNGSPYTQVLPGQLSTSQCPVGYQAANGLIAAIGVGTFTECWPANAWAAYRLGGAAWEQFTNSGGSYDATAELDRRARIAELKQLAKSVAQTAADSTPGIQRCSTWSGYGESGQECAYAFVAPTRSTTPTADSGTATQRVESRTASTSSASDTASAIANPSDPFPSIASGAEIPGTRVVSSAGMARAAWESSRAHTELVCPAGSGRAVGVDLNGTTASSDDRWYSYCVKLWRATSSPLSESSTAASAPRADTRTALSDSSPTTSDTNTTAAATTPEVAVLAVTVKGTTSELLRLVPNVTTDSDLAQAIAKVLTRVEALNKTSSVKTVRLPSNSSVEESAISLTPKICTAVGNTVIFKRTGNCSLTYTLADAAENQFTTSLKVRYTGK